MKTLGNPTRTTEFVVIFDKQLYLGYYVFLHQYWIARPICGTATRFSNPKVITGNPLWCYMTSWELNPYLSHDPTILPQRTQGVCSVYE